MAGSSTADAAFYFDLGDPQSWLVAERILQTLEFPCEWVPVLGLNREWEGARCAEELASRREDVERAALDRGLLPVRWPAAFPFDSERAQLVATYAKAIGRAVPYALAAFRQAFAGARSLEDEDALLIAGAACEMHPAATLTGARTKATRRALDEATAQAVARGAVSTPAIWAHGRMFHGDAGLDEAYRHTP